MRSLTSVLIALVGLFIVVGNGELSLAQVKEAYQDVRCLTGLSINKPIKIVVAPARDLPGACAEYFPERRLILIASDSVDRPTVVHELTHVVLYDRYGVHPEARAYEIEAKVPREW